VLPNLARPSRVTLVTNILPKIDGFVNNILIRISCFSSHVRRSLLVSNNDCTFFIRMVLKSFVEETNCGYVVRLVSFGVTYDIQLIALSNFVLSPFSYWTTSPSWPCTVAIVLFGALTCYPGTMVQIPMLKATSTLPLSVLNT